MGRRARNKQGPPAPLSDSDAVRRNNKGKRKAISTPSVRDQYKAVKGIGAKSSKDRQRRAGKPVRKVEEVDDGDSDLDEALRPG